MKTLAIALFATVALAGNVLAASYQDNAACFSSAISPNGIWDCR